MSVKNQEFTDAKNCLCATFSLLLLFYSLAPINLFENKSLKENGNYA